MNPTHLLLALRPQQWVKNLFVFAALVFARGEYAASGVVHDASDVRRTVFAFLAFCLGSSAIYLVNDCADAESDRKHPTKRHRAIACGKLSVRAAMTASILCFLGALDLAHLADGQPVPVVWAVGAYMALNL